MANKFKTTLAAILNVAEDIVYLGDITGMAEVPYVLKTPSNADVVVFEYENIAEELEDKAEELGRPLTSEEKAAAHAKATFKFPQQTVLVDEAEGTWLVDMDGKMQKFDFRVSIGISIYHMGLRSPKNTPLEIIEGYDELDGEVPRPE